MNHTADRCLAMSDVSDEEVGSDDDGPVYESKKGTKNTGEDIYEDMLLGKLIETPVKTKKSPVDKINKYAVHSVVGTELFLRVRFIDRVNGLVYSQNKNTICDFDLS